MTDLKESVPRVVVDPARERALRLAIEAAKSAHDVNIIALARIFHTFLTCGDEQMLKDGARRTVTE